MRWCCGIVPVCGVLQLVFRIVVVRLNVRVNCARLRVASLLLRCVFVVCVLLCVSVMFGVRLRVRLLMCVSVPSSVPS